MKEFEDTQVVKQLDKRRGSYFHVVIDAKVINQFEEGRKTRFICTLDDKLKYQCGLNHLGDGNFFIIVSAARLKKINKSKGEKIHFKLEIDPNPLGVEFPEVLKELLNQDEDLKAIFDKLSMGKKRHVIHNVLSLKTTDLQIQKAIELIQSHA